MMAATSVPINRTISVVTLPDKGLVTLFKLEDNLLRQRRGLFSSLIKSRQDGSLMNFGVSDEPKLEMNCLYLDLNSQGEFLIVSVVKSKENEVMF